MFVMSMFMLKNHNLNAVINLKVGLSNLTMTHIFKCSLKNSSQDSDLQLFSHDCLIQS
jgi:hypothetical protein